MSFLSKSVVCPNLLLLFVLQVISQQPDVTSDAKLSKDSNFSYLVAGGLPASEHRANLMKYIVSIRLFHAVYVGENHFCAGTIIKKDVILTAAHCFTQHPNMDDYYIHTAVNRRLTDKSEAREIKKVVKHGGYDFPANDIAMVILKEEIVINGRTTGIIEMITDPIPPGTMCTTLGWGRVLPDGPMSAELLYIDIYTMSDKQCKQKIQHFWTPGMLCAMDENDREKDACGADSGGPFICNGKLGGVVSTGFVCANGEYPGIYTSLAHYSDWLERNIVAIESSATRFKLNKMILCLLIIREISIMSGMIYYHY